MESEQDSGNNSATLKTARTTEPEESTRDTMPQIDEIMSITSDIDDIGSQASGETTREAMTGKALIIMFLQEHSMFRSLCERALCGMSRERFVKNMTRLLRSFHKDLLQEARSESEKAAAKLLRSERGRSRISEQLAAHIQKEDNHALHNRDDSLQITLESASRVEKWLAAASLQPQPLADSTFSFPQNSSSEGEASDEESSHTFIPQLKRFLSTSRSFQILQRDLMVLFLPVNLRHVLNSEPKGDIWLSNAQDVSLSNKAKAWIEDHTRVKWDWWPLNPRKRTLQDNEG